MISDKPTEKQQFLNTYRLSEDNLQKVNTHFSSNVSDLPNCVVIPPNLNY